MISMGCKSITFQSSDRQSNLISFALHWWSYKIPECYCCTVNKTISFNLHKWSIKCPPLVIWMYQSDLGHFQLPCEAATLLTSLCLCSGPPSPWCPLCASCRRQTSCLPVSVTRRSATLPSEPEPGDQNKSFSPPRPRGWAGRRGSSASPAAACSTSPVRPATRWGHHLDRDINDVHRSVQPRRQQTGCQLCCRPGLSPLHLEEVQHWDWILQGMFLHLHPAGPLQPASQPSPLLQPQQDPGGLQVVHQSLRLHSGLLQHSAWRSVTWSYSGRWKRTK